MASINFEQHGTRGKNGGSPQTITGVSSAAFTNWNNDRVVNVTPALVGTMGVPAGWYERGGLDASGNITYIPATR